MPIKPREKSGLIIEGTCQGVGKFLGNGISRFDIALRRRHQGVAVLYINVHYSFSIYVDYKSLKKKVGDEGIEVRKGQSLSQQELIEESCFSVYELLCEMDNESRGLDFVNEEGDEEQ